LADQSSLALLMIRDYEITIARYTIASEVSWRRVVSGESNSNCQIGDWSVQRVSRVSVILSNGLSFQAHSGCCFIHSTSTSIHTFVDAHFTSLHFTRRTSWLFDRALFVRIFHA